MAKPKAKAEEAPKDDKKTVDELAKLVTERAQAFCNAMNQKFKAERATAVTETKKALAARLKKKGKDGKIDAEKLKKGGEHLAKALPSFKMSVSDTVVSTGQRSATDQAYYAIMGWSKTCSSAHMRRAAIHVTIDVTRDGKTEKIGMKTDKYFPAKYAHSDHVTKSSWAIMSHSTFAAIWKAQLKAAKLANWGGRLPDFAPKDPWHVELPRKAAKGGVSKEDTVKGTRPGRADLDVKQCVEKYAEYVAITEKLDKKKKKARNTKIETLYKKIFKKSFAEQKKAVDAERKKAKTAKDKAALKKKHEARAKKLLTDINPDLKVIEKDKPAEVKGRLEALPH